jgi:hypothetical protein
MAAFNSCRRDVTSGPGIDFPGFVVSEESIPMTTGPAINRTNRTQTRFRRSAARKQSFRAQNGISVFEDHQG